jgi:hypothetical protein
MNRKGQVLVMFIILLPIFFLIMTLLIDIGNLILTNNEINDVSYIVLEYCLDHLDEEDIIDNSQELLKLNNKNIIIESFKIDNNKVYLNVSYQVKGIISNIANIKLFNINNKYEAYIKDDKKIIERIK